MEIEKKETILFVDDELTMLDIANEYLGQKGYKVATARNGVEAVKIVENKDIDLCVVDINMPLMGGHEFSEYIRMKYNTIPVIIITGFPTLDNVHRAAINGAVDFLIKPFDLNQMEHCVRRALHERKIFINNLLLKRNAELKEIKKQLTVMIVEDILGIANEYFVQKGHIMITAKNEFEALEIIEENEIDCCFIDIEMHRMDGFELIENIRLKDNTIPVIIMTPPDFLSMDDSIRTMKNGVVHLIKPININQMELCMQRVLRERKFLIEKVLEKRNTIESINSLKLFDKSEIIIYELQLSISSDQISIGSEHEVTIAIFSGKADSNSKNTVLIEIPQNEAIGNEFNILITASGFHFKRDNATSFPIGPHGGGTFPQLIQTAYYHLTAIRPGPTKITADFYLGNKFLKTLERKIQIIGIGDIPIDRPLVRLQPSPVPKPDIILQIYTQWNKDFSTLTFHYLLRSFRQPVSFPEGIQYQSQSFQTKWIEQTQSLLTDTLEHITHASPSDTCTRLASFGSYLFNKLFPPAMQKEYYNVAGFIRTLLIIADQDASYPWELLHDGEAFFSERFIMGRWFRELDNQRPYEFPVGMVNIAHYENVEHPELWASLLGSRGAPMPHMLQDGMLQELKQTESMRGLHLIRSGLPPGKYTQHDAPVHIHADHANTNIEEKVRPAKLNLRRNRPLVTLGYISAGNPELTNLEQTWAPTFIRAGCSAFAGPLWAVNPAVEAAFVSSFYTRLWAGDSLGTAFQTARNSARTAVPDSVDWLAYVLYGDPMARPYRPIKGQGYAAIEPIGREIDDPLPPNTPARFRVSLRRTPPVWHEARVIEVAESLEFDNLQCHVVASGIKITPEPPIDMKRTPNNDYIGWLTLTAPGKLAGETAIIQLFFEDGENPVHSLRFSIQIENPKGDQS